MKKIALTILMVLACQVAYAELTPLQTTDVASKLKQIYEKKKALKALTEQMRIDEEQLATQYKVKECNDLRNQLILNYRSQQEPLYAAIQQLEDEIGQTV